MGSVKKTFPTGEAHNARTCGKTPTAAKRKPSRNNLTSPSKVGKRQPQKGTIADVNLSQVTGGRRVREGRVPSGDFLNVWVDDGVLLVQTVESDEYINYVMFPKEWAVRYEYIDDEGDRYWFNESSLAHREGRPAIEYEDGGEEWWEHGKRSRISGPAVDYASGYREWWVNGIQTEHPSLCEKAILLNLTDEEFYQLCSHEDYVVRQLAANNPECPVEWRVFVDIMYG